ncbi:DUF475 domain-containing protein [Chitinimonas sp. BJB300]|uniref:DUF475 domain-containing protein n=1 Tax=Chitinimonas sp. BJB300 TaxID=1559339 RepID=UPI000C0DD11F|nr:DUF475 domain-containing protein [Chitinimonas sp. BJB300]PHV12605.1 hypothetical protein CSQ89_04840 [Chitinimonas sp. BJB300]TSJ89921.1 DUF475 domain-containing protein [Chitinimonas sp. BJB300]
MPTLLKYFKGSVFVTVAGLVAAYLIGGTKAAFIAAILSVLEVSLSFDNAVVNATVLKDMDDKWRHRFMTWGMLIAVFGMRVVFPVLIVAVLAQLNPWAAFMLAVSEPVKYAETLTSAHVVVAGFGGAFLMMVFLKFFLDKEKDVHWVRLIEAPLSKLGKMEAVEIAVCLAVVYGISTMLHEEERFSFVIAAVAGLVTYIVVDGFASLLETEQPGDAGVVARTGLSAFLYLEVLDASFSFDGVIGAFALSNNIFIIAIGLGIGAMFVRSLTIMFVEKQTLDQFRYLEHGAFYAIGALATIMFVGTFHEVSEVATGLIGAGFIGLALWSSVRHNKST